jgi:hypothetical protein
MSPKKLPSPLSSYTTTLSKFYIMDLRTNEVFDIPFPPIDISERPNMPNFTSDSVLGRTSQYVTYMMSNNREVTVNLTIIDDYVAKPLSEVRDLLSSMAMPIYDHYVIKEPKVQIKLGAIVLRGVITDLTFTWGGIYRDGLWNTLTVSMSFKEARQIPLGATEVRAGGWNNG